MSKKSDIVDELKMIVDRFNISFKNWSKDTRCAVNFGWNYKTGKILEIVSIDMPLYKKPIPEFDNPTSVKDVLKQATK